MQKPTKAHIDGLVADLVEGGSITAKGRRRRPWSADSVNKLLANIEQVLGDAKDQGLVSRNVAVLVNRVATQHKQVDTYTEAEVLALLTALADDRLRDAWELALSGLRRGEVAGLRWSDVDLDAGTLTIVDNRVSAGGKTVENDPEVRGLPADVAAPGPTAHCVAVGEGSPNGRTVRHGQGRLRVRRE